MYVKETRLFQRLPVKSTLALPSWRSPAHPESGCRKRFYIPKFSDSSRDPDNWPAVFVTYLVMTGYLPGDFASMSPIILRNPWPPTPPNRRVAVQVALHGVLGEQGFIDASHVEWGIHSNLVSARRVVSLELKGNSGSRKPAGENPIKYRGFL